MATATGNTTPAAIDTAPQCGSRAKDAWLQGRLADVLECALCPLAFTLPHSLNALYQYHLRWVIDTLFASTAQTLSEFAANARWMGLVVAPRPSAWYCTPTQDLRLHIHVHAVMACGVLVQDDQGQGRWHTPIRKPDFLFPVQALSKVFRASFWQPWAGPIKVQTSPRSAGRCHGLAQRQRDLYRHDWVVYAKTLLCGPAQTLEYFQPLHPPHGHWQRAHQGAHAQ
ncbi:transposase [Candidatus Aalborgicola defluviihabitans]|uniref:transposase n=1 Tax=Candidatus Aalborgicola defluviihabitans TaxID=3386187 RepID=UPI0039B83B57